MSVQILVGDCLEQLRGLPAESVHCAVTSPPYYGLRDYGVEGAIGLEATPDEHIQKLVEVFREVRRVLREDGTLWLNYGDSYSHGGNGSRNPERWPKQSRNDHRLEHPKKSSGLKPKDLLMMPERVALALQADGWWVRSRLPWLKRNPMPDSATDRPGSSVEYVFLLTKSARCFFDMEAVRKADLGTDHARSVLDRPEPSGGVMSPHMGIRKAEGRNGSGRNFRNADLFYASLEPPHGLIWGEDGPLAFDVNTAPFPEAHFATFPPALVEPCIKAGTSEKGVCAECGAPWVRGTSVEYIKNRPSAGNDKRARGEDNFAKANGAGGFRGNNLLKQTQTTGWSPSCACNADPVPATCLDPFGGAGTVGLVADRLGRDAILIELNPEYAGMARRRIDRDAATRGRGPEPIMRGDDLPLFEVAP